MTSTDTAKSVPSAVAPEFVPGAAAAAATTSMTTTTTTTTAEAVHDGDGSTSNPVESTSTPQSEAETSQHEAATSGSNPHLESKDAENDTTATAATIPLLNSDEVRKKEESEVTRRLQNLILERQKESRQDRLRVIQADSSSHLSSARTFQELNLPKHLLDAIFEMGYERPSAIQEEALPRILADQPRNLIGQAQSGSGKTAAFVLGMLYRTVVDSPATTQTLCVTPTRELAVQIVNSTVLPMAAHMTGLKVRLALAGEQVERGRGVEAHLVVGTPGKIVNWLKYKTIQTKHIKVFVLDEADNMVEEGGHRANSLLIKKMMPKTCQSLFFSATFPPKVVDFASKMVHDPDKILVADGPEFLVLDVIKQIWVDTRSYPNGNSGFLSDIYSLLTIGQSIVFVATKHTADEVHATLSADGYSCSVLHGRVEHADRDATMEAFRNGESNVLITTNVLARGVDVDNVCLVVNYDVPVTMEGRPDFETYLHRIGRTGRFGRKGTAITLCKDQRSIEVLAAIEGHFARGGKEMIQNAEADPESLAEIVEV